MVWLSWYICAPSTQTVQGIREPQFRPGKHAKLKAPPRHVGIRHPIMKWKTGWLQTPRLNISIAAASKIYKKSIMKLSNVVLWRWRSNWLLNNAMIGGCLGGIHVDMLVTMYSIHNQLQLAKQVHWVHVSTTFTVHHNGHTQKQAQFPGIYIYWSN